MAQFSSACTEARRKKDILIFPWYGFLSLAYHVGLKHRFLCGLISALRCSVEQYRTLPHYGQDQRIKRTTSKRKSVAICPARLERTTRD